jgi:PAS domain S-box-containing protein
LDSARILIVDDQIPALKGVSRILTSAGYDTFEANSGEDCLKLAAEHKPDLILLDVVLPDIDGKEVCRRIKSNPETADSYVVLFSSIQVESDRQAEGLEQGADGYIARPIPNRELLARVKSILRLKRAENRLSESEEKYRNIFNSAGVGMFRSRLDGSEILDVNDKFLQILNQTREDVIGKPSVIVWADPHEREKMVRSLNTDGKVTDAEIRVLTGEGEERTCLNSAKLYPDKGIIEGYVVDITERKRTEENILASEQRLGAITNSAFDAIILINDRGEISYWNPASERIFGYSDSEVVGKNVHELLAPPEFHAAYHSAFKDFVTSGRGNAMGKITPLVARRKDGEEFPIELSLSGFQTGQTNQAHPFPVISSGSYKIYYSLLLQIV